MSIEIKRSDKYVDYNISAANNRGYITIDTSDWINKPWMFYELPSLKFEIYTETNGELLKYQKFSREIRTYNPVYSPLGVLNVTIDIRNVPKEFILRITPIFDNDAVAARNMLVENGIEDGVIWGSDQDVPTQLFNLNLEFIECEGEYVPPTPPVPPTHEETITGVPPITFDGSTGEPLVSWTILGNGQQISPNLVDPSKTVAGYQNNDGTIHEPSGGNERTTDWIPFADSDKVWFIISGSNTGNLNYVLYDDDKQPLYFWGGGFNPNVSARISKQYYSAAAYVRISWTNAANQPICVTYQQTTTFIGFTPTPDAPIMPEFCGVRTGNLIDLPEQTISFTNLIVRAKGSVVTFEGNGFSGEVYGTNAKWKTLTFDLPAGTYTINPTPRPVNFTGMQVNVYDSSDNRIAGDGVDTTFTLQEDTTCHLGFYVYNQKEAGVYTYNIMLNLGSTALPYEPFGYEIPITNAGQTTPVYLGQTQTVRKIKKLVLDGTENWSTEPISGIRRAFMQLPDQVIPSIGLSTHYIFQSGKYEDGYCSIGQTGMLYIYSSTYASGANAFKSYLAQEYANGTPVTIWYVIATEQTGIVNEPLAKIGDYADELSSTDAGVTIPTARGQNVLTVDTDLQPSEMTITYVKDGQ